MKEKKENKRKQQLKNLVKNYGQKFGEIMTEKYEILNLFYRTPKHLKQKKHYSMKI